MSGIEKIIIKVKWWNLIRICQYREKRAGGRFGCKHPNIISGRCIAHNCPVNMDRKEWKKEKENGKRRY